jgi:hypothetical protein
MESKIVIEITNEHEASRLLSLIEDGMKILNKQQRSQRGIDGYTYSELSKWHSTISKCTNVKCEFADGEI